MMIVRAMQIAERVAQMDLSDFFGCAALSGFTILAFALILGWMADRSEGQG